jgi:hypothetical protein
MRNSVDGEFFACIFSVLLVFCYYQGVTVFSWRKGRMFLGRNVVKTTILLILIVAILFFVTGCGPGQPFEIEGLFAP